MLSSLLVYIAGFNLILSLEQFKSVCEGYWSVVLVLLSGFVIKVILASKIIWEKFLFIFWKIIDRIGFTSFS